MGLFPRFTYYFYTYDDMKHVFCRMVPFGSPLSGVDIPGHKLRILSSADSDIVYTSPVAVERLFSGGV